MLTNSGAASKTSPAQHTANECCHALQVAEGSTKCCDFPRQLWHEKTVIYYFLLVYLLNLLYFSDGMIPKFTSISMPIPIKCSISIPILGSDSRFQF